MKYQELDKLPRIKDLAYAVFFEEEENGYFIAYFRNLKQAKELFTGFFDWICGRITGKDAIIYENYFLLAQHYIINTNDCYSQYMDGIYTCSNGIQSIYIKKIDLNNFDLQMFFYERKMYETIFSYEELKGLPKLMQEFLYGLIKN